MLEYKIESFDDKTGLAEVSYGKQGAEAVNRIAVQIPVKDNIYPSVAEVNAIIESALPTKDYWDRLDTISAKIADSHIKGMVGVIYTYEAKAATLEASQYVVEV